MGKFLSIVQLGFVLLVFASLAGCGERNALTNAMDQKRLEPRESASILATDVVERYILIGMTESEAITFLQAAGFEEKRRFSEPNRFDHRPIESEYYIIFYHTAYKKWIFDYQVYTIELATTDGKVEQLQASIQWYALGIS